MKILYAKIEKTSDGYDVFTETEIFSGMGNTVEAAKKDMEEQISEYVRFCKEQSRKYPEYLDGGYEIRYRFEVQSLLNYYDGILSNAAIERLTGINQKQIWSYANGKTKPRAEQKKKIEHALHALGDELKAVSL